MECAAALFAVEARSVDIDQRATNEDIGNCATYVLRSQLEVCRFEWVDGTIDYHAVREPEEPLIAVEVSKWC